MNGHLRRPSVGLVLVVAALVAALTATGCANSSGTNGQAVRTSGVAATMPPSQAPPATTKPPAKATAQQPAPASNQASLPATGGMSLGDQEKALLRVLHAVGCDNTDQFKVPPPGSKSAQAGITVHSGCTLFLTDGSTPTPVTVAVYYFARGLGAFLANIREVAGADTSPLKYLIYPPAGKWALVTYGATTGTAAYLWGHLPGTLMQWWPVP